MTSRDFCFWLQGFFELQDPAHSSVLSAAQVDRMRRHLALVFKHEIDPSMGDKPAQDALNEIHSSKPEKPATHAPIGGSGPHATVYRC